MNTRVAHPLNATRVFICKIYSNLTIKHCDKTKVKTITVKNSKNSKNSKKRRRFDVYSTSFSSQNE